VCGGCVRRRLHGGCGAHTAHRRARDFRDFLDFSAAATGVALADSRRVIWFFEKEADLLVCEIRHAESGAAYEFEIADSTGPTTHRFDSPTELIAKYLDEQSRLLAEGWRPRAGNVTTLE
jgi:hypothetical protein